MAATQYTVFCKLLNSVSGRPITNTETREWGTAFYEYLSDDDKAKYSKGPYSGKENTDEFKIPETLILVGTGVGSTGTDADAQKKIAEGAYLGNPKYNLVFTYAGCDIMYTGTKGNIPYILADKYERIFMTPWFVHSVHGSLQSAMTKAQLLVKKIGVDSVKIGKMVSLDQYIDIV